MSDAPVKNHACDACGQLDTHPMIHVNAPWKKDDRLTISDPSFHFDCLPEEFEALLGNGPEHATTRAAIDAARSGVHGNKLRELIESKPDDNTLEA